MGMCFVILARGSLWTQAISACIQLEAIDFNLIYLRSLSVNQGTRDSNLLLSILCFCLYLLRPHDISPAFVWFGDSSRAELALPVLPEHLLGAQEREISLGRGPLPSLPFPSLLCTRVSRGQHGLGRQRLVTFHLFHLSIALVFM